jgi:hypothetical protein
MQDLVIARYNEDLNWVNYVSNLNIYIYNKGEKLVTNHKVIELENIGRESHTYISHILRNYGKLNDTIFSQGNPFTYTKDFIIKCYDYKGGYVEFNSPMVQRTDDVYPEWQGKGIDFRYYYKLLFGKDYEFDTIEFNPEAIFGVSKEILESIPFQFYLKIKDLLIKDPHFAWTMERLWRFIFKVKYE